MIDGKSIGRQWVLMLKDGRVVVDWSNGTYQDLYNGEFVTVSELDVSHILHEVELDYLKRTGYVLDFTDTLIYLPQLPEKQQPAME